jgi:tetratricopeptide (TPR) repeat protein
LSVKLYGTGSRVFGISALAITWSLAANAQEAAAPAPAAAPATSAGGVPKDPNGVKGISPFWETLKLGDSAYLARDFDTAGARYREAIKQSPNNPIGHLRLAEVHMKKGELAEAEQALNAVERFAGKDQTAKAKALFLKAELQERQKAYKPAVAAWTTYQQFGQQQPSAKVHQKTPPERVKRIQAAEALAKDYAAVKERIAERLKDAEEKARKSAQ